MRTYFKYQQRQSLQQKSSIDNSADLLAALNVGYTSSTGVEITPNRAMQHATVFQCVRVLAESVGILPVGFFEKKDNIRIDTRNHYLYKVLCIAPNEYQTAQDFWETCVAHLSWRGKFFALKTVVNGQVRELLPLHPDSVDIEQNSDYSLSYKVSFSEGITKTLSRDEIFHINLFTLDGYTGVSPIAYTRHSIGLGVSLEKHSANLFKNGARPGGILSSDAKISEEQAIEYRRVWESTHGGSGGSGKTAVLGSGLQYQAIGLSSVDSQHLESRSYQKAEIAAIYRVPLYKINDMAGTQYNNIEHQGLEFANNSILPYVTKIEANIKQQLLKPSEQPRYFAKFNINALLRGDMAARGDFYTKLVQNGALSPNEIRELEDRNPRDGGDVYLTPMNMAINGKPIESDSDSGKE